MNKKTGIVFLVLVTVFSAACGDKQTGNGTAATKTKNAYPPQVQNILDEVAAHPDSGNIRLKLVYALDSIGDFTNALQNINIILKKDSTNYRLWLNRGSIAEDAKDTLAAMESYANALRIYRSPDAMLSLANLYAETKNPRALLFTSRVKSLGLGKEYDAHSAFVTGIYYARTGKRAEALQAFDECIANNYTYMVAYIEKGLVYFDNKQYDEALKVFEFAATVDNLYADAYYYQARCYEMTGKKDLAVEKFHQSLSIDKTLAEAHAGLKRLGAE